MEQILEVDEQDQVIGLRPREDFYSGQYIHRSAHLILLNSKNEMLLQKRAKSRIWYPGLYTFSVSGTVEDETYEACIHKEIKEEIGLDIIPKKLFVEKCFDIYDKSFECIFLAHSDEQITIDKEEAESIKWICLSDLKKELTLHPEQFTPGVKIGMKRFFEEYEEKFL